MQQNSPLFKKIPELFSFPGDTLTIAHPADEIRELHYILTPVGEIINFDKNQRLNMIHHGENVFYLLLGGYYSFRYHRKGTIIGNIYSPSVAGLGEIFTSKNVGYYRAESTASTIRVSYSGLMNCLAQHPDLWLSIVRILAHTTQRIFLRDQQINTKNAYLVVCNLLQDMNNQPPEIKTLTPAVHYILDRTMLSRSTVMQILSDLHRGKFIEIKRGGFLSKINKLPEQLL